jgi:hypothetical protein
MTQTKSTGHCFHRSAMIENRTLSRFLIEFILELLTMELKCFSFTFILITNIYTDYNRSIYSNDGCYLCIDVFLLPCGQ